MALALEQDGSALTLVGCVSRAVFTSSLKLLLLLFPDANKRGIMIIIMVNLFHKVVLKTKSMNIYKVLEIGHYI